ncbi:MAG: response regulator transcription factor [Sphaerochaeta sp.]
MDGKTILVVDDEQEMVNMLSLHLRSHGYNVISTTYGKKSLEMARNELPDLILLDIMMPDMDGKQVCQFLKSQIVTRAIPVILVSAKDQVQDKIDGLSVGADDYLTKPFDLKELILRVEAAIRQVELLESKNSLYEVGNVILDTKTFQVKKNEDKLDLTLTEFRILQQLMSKKNNVVTKVDLVNYIFEKSIDESGRVLDVHIRNLRKKLSSNGECTCMIKTIRGIGYVCKEKD